ncbi:MAG: hypothetical protein N4A33_00275 [Bacteriovoracaceae bacterium]|jgi:hypothetical protein|nr:hypothetical protein [Bacteriovoracaceae bacterium]
MRVKLVKKNDELMHFQNSAHKYIGVCYPYEFLKSVKVYGLYRKKNLIGGFILNLDQEIRTLEGLPTKIKEDFLKQHNIEHFYEITGLWIHLRYRKTLYSWRLILSLALNSLFVSKKYCIYSYSAKSRELRRIYSLSAPELIYEGKVRKIEGMKSEDFEVVEMSRKNRGAILMCYAYAISLFKVFFRKISLKRKILWG